MVLLKKLVFVYHRLSLFLFVYKEHALFNNMSALNLLKELVIEMKKIKEHQTADLFDFLFREGFFY